MKAFLFFSFLFLSFICFAQDYSAAWAERRKCDHDLIEIDSKIKVLNSEYEQIKKDLSGGYYCSKCMRSKTEIEKSGNESFEQHLKNVKGERIPASQKQFDDAHKSYMVKYNSLANSFENKKNYCTERIADLNERTYNKWIDEQNELMKKEEARLQALQKEEQEKERLALKLENERLKKQAEKAAAEQIKMSVTKEKNQGIGIQNDKLNMQQNIQVSESVNNYLDSQTDISNSLSQSASKKMNNINSLLNETNTEKVDYIDEMKNKIQSIKGMFSTTDNNTSVNLDDYDNSESSTSYTDKIKEKIKSLKELFISAGNNSENNDNDFNSQKDALDKAYEIARSNDDEAKSELLKLLTKPKAKMSDVMEYIKNRLKAVKDGTTKIQENAMSEIEEKMDKITEK